MANRDATTKKIRINRPVALNVLVVPDDSRVWDVVVTDAEGTVVGEGGSLGEALARAAEVL